MADSKLAPHRDAIATALVSGSWSVNQLAQHYGVARSTMQTFVKNHVTADQAVPVVNGANLAVVQAQVKDLQLRLKTAQARAATEAVIVDELRRAIEQAPVKYEPLALDPNIGAKPHSMALLLSDTHAGEVVDERAVHGLNSYSWEVVVERMAHLQKSLLSFHANRPYPIDELQVWCLGDMLSGHNHLELEVTNEFPTAEQAYRFGILLGQWIEELIPVFPRLVVRGVVGNHPRVPAKMGAKEAFNSFDWLSYKIAEVYLSQYIEAGAVECHFDDATYDVAEIAGRQILLMHGDGIRSTMPGIPWGGVGRRVSNLKNEFRLAGIDLYGVALGHFHSPNWVRVAGGTHIWMNGSVKGPDEWSIKQFGDAAPPEQLLLTFNPDKQRLTDVSSLNP